MDKEKPKYRIVLVLETYDGQNYDSPLSEAFVYEYFEKWQTAQTQYRVAKEELKKLHKTIAEMQAFQAGED